jgi:hypothetical protein
MIQKKDAKRLLAESIMQLAKKKPLEKITVSQITENCMMSRETFYYHFVDKYELINWVYENQVYDKHVLGFKGIEPWESTVERSVEWVRGFKENQDFIQNALKDTHPNGFHDGLVKCAFRILSAHACCSLGTAQLSKEILFYINIFSHGIVGMSENWLSKGMKEPETFMGEMIVNSMPPPLKKVYSRD